MRDGERETLERKYRNNGKSDCLMKFRQRVLIDSFVKGWGFIFAEPPLLYRSFRRLFALLVVPLSRISPRLASCLESSLQGIQFMSFSQAWIGGVEDGFLFNGNSRIVRNGTETEIEKRKG